jgi:hypothetical protein
MFTLFDLHDILCGQMRAGIFLERGFEDIIQLMRCR